jgi:pimeloyl-ACP methyl ester carboxylesterase
MTPPEEQVVELSFDLLPGTGAGERAAFSFVMIHGWGRSRSDWVPVVKGLAAVAPVVAVDLRGHGASGPGAGMEGADMELAHVAGDVSALVHRLGLAPVVLVGHSAGSEVAALLARHDPARVAGLVVIDPAFGLPDGDRARIEAVAGRLRTQEPERVAGEYFDSIGPSPLLPRLPETGGVLAAGPRAVREMFTQFAFGPDVLHFESQARAFFDDFPVPVLAIYRSEQRARIGRGILGSASAVVLVKPGGHWIHHEYPGEVVAAIAEWTVSLPGARVLRGRS